jgi:hypothetical protein
VARVDRRCRNSICSGLAKQSKGVPIPDVSFNVDGKELIGIGGSGRQREFGDNCWQLVDAGKGPKESRQTFDFRGRAGVISPALGA